MERTDSGLRTHDPRWHTSLSTHRATFPYSLELIGRTVSVK